MNWRSFFTPQVLGIFHSKINREIKIVEHFGRKTLFVSGAPQSGGEMLLMWEKVVKKVKSQKSKVKSCLVLGIGGGNVITILRKYYSEIKITAIEIDPVMIMIAQKYFGLDTSNIHVTIADAVSWIRKHKSSRSHKVKFDLIVVDLFVGKLNPSPSRTFNFLLKLKELVSREGLILYNSHYQEDNKSEYGRFLKDCGLVFKTEEEVFRYRNNRLLLLG